METPKTIEKFLNRYNAKGTIKGYRSILKKYFTVIGKDPDTYFTTEQDYENGVLAYWKSLSEHPPRTIKTSISCVRMFLSENDIELPVKFWRGIENRTKGSRAVTEDKIPTAQEFKRILSHADVRGRAMFMTLLQSGMRIGELAKLEIKDIDFTTTPTRIRIRAEVSKTGDQRYCFIGKEATDMLKAYLEQRPKYINASKNRVQTFNKYHKRRYIRTDNEERVFPLDVSIIRYSWNLLLKHAKLSDRDDRTKRHKMHPHVLRKYYRTHMNLNVPFDVVEALLGHETYLAEAYRRYSIDQLADMYLKGEKDVSIFESTSEEVKKLQVSDKEKGDEIQAMKAEITELRLQILEMKSKVH